MMHTLVVTAVVLVVYAFAGLAVLAVYRAGTATDASRTAQAARRPAQRARPPAEPLTQPSAPPGTSAADDPLSAAEADATRRLISGRLDAAGYRRIMASLAARDAARHPVTGPEPPRQDDGPGLR